MHSTQPPEPRSHTGASDRAEQASLAPQGPQSPVASSQTGLVPGQSASLAQPAHCDDSGSQERPAQAPELEAVHVTQAPVAASQATSPQAWALNGVHSTQLPVAGLQASNPGRSAQSASLVQVRQRSATGSHTGLEAGQSASSRQPTQVETEESPVVL